VRELTFSSLSLISEKEERALSINFGSESTVLEAPNGSGKSAIMKSLYEALGASPHKVVPEWQNANVTSLLKFEIDGKHYSALRAYGTYGIFDDADNLLIRTQSITRELSPFLARLLNFHLVMKDRREESLVPPPSYIFAPYYIDQDSSWSNVWESFSDLYLPRSGLTLAEYHSGTKGNAYYEAQARIDELKRQEAPLLATMKALSDALREIRDIAPDVNIQFDPMEFAAERERLLAEAKNLFQQQATHRGILALLHEERYVWQEQVELISATLSEMGEDLDVASKLPVDVECPTCGHHHDNSISARFGIVEHKDTLLSSMSVATEKIRELTHRIDAASSALSVLLETSERLAATLGISRDDLRYEEIVAAEGRREAAKILGSKLSVNDLAMADIERQISHQNDMKRAATDRKRSVAIREFFNQKMAAFSARLDVQIDDRRSTPLHMAGRSRGSEGARELVAYYYAFLHTARAYGSSVYCPIVVDAPNQQGQDAKHLPQVLEFLAKNRPRSAQLIIAVEDAGPIRARPDVTVIKVGISSRQVLDAAQYVTVRALVAPYVDQLLRA